MANFETSKQTRNALGPFNLPPEYELAPLGTRWLGHTGRLGGNLQEEKVYK